MKDTNNQKSKEDFDAFASKHSHVVAYRDLPYENFT